MSKDSGSQYERLSAQADREFPESWIPKEAGERIVGEFLRLDRGTTARGPAHIVVLRTPEGVERGVWLLHVVLRNEFRRLQPKPGELVLVKYEGTRQKADGDAYHAYKVAVDREAQPAAWDELDGDGGEDLFAPIEIEHSIEQKVSDGNDDIPF